jgi:hypothetical protein
MSNTTTYNFKDAVYEWMKLNDETTALQREVRLKRNKMNAISQYIVTFMKDQDKEVCNVGETSSLVLKKRKVTSSLKKEDVLNALRRHTNEENATNTANMLYANRCVTFKDYIKLTGT